MIELSGGADVSGGIHLRSRRAHGDDEDVDELSHGQSGGDDMGV